jgi:hypothetical protein
MSGIGAVVVMLCIVGRLLARNGRFGVVEGTLCGAFVILIGAAIGFTFFTLRVAKTDGWHAWIGGFGRGFLATLPEWTGHSDHGHND